MSRNSTAIFNDAKNILINKGWVYAGMCNTCSSEIGKFTYGKWFIKMYKRIEKSRLLFRNQTIKNVDTKDIKELTDYVDREAEVPAGASR